MDKVFIMDENELKFDLECLKEMIDDLEEKRYDAVLKLLKDWKEEIEEKLKDLEE